MNFKQENINIKRKNNHNTKLTGLNLSTITTMNRKLRIYLFVVLLVDMKGMGRL